MQSSAPARGGTALAQTLALNGQNVGLWARKDSVVHGINHEHVNPRYLSDTVLSGNIVATTSYCDALLRAKAAVIVTPSNLLRGVARAIGDVVDDDFPIIICSKASRPTAATCPWACSSPSWATATAWPCCPGPNHAEEVIKQAGRHVIASSGEDTAVLFRDLFASPTFRTYTSDDVTGVELCAAFKNVIAIAVGVAYGLGYGDNTAAMLMTRGLAEMSRLVVKCGGQAITCMGLAGAGDLIATCTSEHSRNRSFGVELARGGTLDEYRERTHMVVEGALACKTLQTLSEAYGVELPITEVVRGVVWEGADPNAAARDLFARPLTTEFYGL